MEYNCTQTFQVFKCTCFNVHIDYILISFGSSVIFSYLSDSFKRQLRSLIKRLFLFREFIDKYYVGIKKENPTMPILVRECSGVQPKMYARYGEFRLAIISSALKIFTK